MTLAEELAVAAATLAAAGVEQPRREARLLLLHATGLDGAGLLQQMHSRHPAPGFEGLVARRAAREPLALITGHQPFWTLDLLVSAATLIPRADTETLMDAALAALPDRRRVRRILDLGTGTGCLLLAALTEFPHAWGLGTDRSPAAAALARRNAVRSGLDGRCAFLCADWADPVAGQFDLVLCNPPYIQTAALDTLMPEVSQYEPDSALDGGVDGLDAYHAVLAAIPMLLRPDGMAVLEVGQGQSQAVRRMAAPCLAVVAQHPDLGGVERALVFRLR